MSTDKCSSEHLLPSLAQNPSCSFELSQLLCQAMPYEKEGSQHPGRHSWGFWHHFGHLQPQRSLLIKRRYSTFGSEWTDEWDHVVGDAPTGE